MHDLRCRTLDIQVMTYGVGHDMRCRMLSSYAIWSYVLSYKSYFLCTISYAISHIISHTMFHLIQIVSFDSTPTISYVFLDLRYRIRYIFDIYSVWLTISYVCNTMSKVNVQCHQNLRCHTQNVVGLFPEHRTYNLTSHEIVGATYNVAVTDLRYHRWPTTSWHRMWQESRCAH